MEQDGLKKSAAMKDAPIMPGEEEFVQRMGQLEQAAVMNIAPTLPSKEEFVSDTEQINY